MKSPFSCLPDWSAPLFNKFASAHGSFTGLNIEDEELQHLSMMDSDFVSREFQAIDECVEFVHLEEHGGLGTEHLRVLRQMQRRPRCRYQDSY